MTNKVGLHSIGTFFLTTSLVDSNKIRDEIFLLFVKTTSRDIKTIYKKSRFCIKQTPVRSEDSYLLCSYQTFVIKLLPCKAV